MKPVARAVAQEQAKKKKEEEDATHAHVLERFKRNKDLKGTNQPIIRHSLTPTLLCGQGRGGNIQQGASNQLVCDITLTMRTLKSSRVQLHRVERDCF